MSTTPFLVSCPRMPPKLPACDPCRSRKVACDHLHPHCSRCRDANLTAVCTYRSRPFKKRQIRSISNKVREPSQQRNLDDPSTPASPGVLLKRPRQYPNPGYLGSSSHTTLFDHLSSGNSPSSDVDDHDQDREKTRHKFRPSLVNDEKIAQGAALIRQVRLSAKASSWVLLVEAWTAKGVNLPLTDSFTMQCAETAQHIVKNLGSRDEDIVTLSKKLFLHSCSSLTTGTDSTLKDFCGTFCESNARWETMGLFFTAVSRATIDLPCFGFLYNTDLERRYLQRLAMQYSDSCLNLALSLDCLNDLQLILQYENFILHSLVDGDQSKRFLLFKRALLSD
ncbi:hypothetical protein BU16DRAFT_303627 [Lophium mytilinum]|uniref:Zn(2)-C6 fungal-type domain-containing protein n=1 Tax=Lophium mytilinum TaxID=390894 RepID=A0A6A6R204_9PEZI|nr:hypothetical protein BU16DRAFT_303627 [Lophium mytilinum]